MTSGHSASGGSDAAGLVENDRRLTWTAAPVGSVASPESMGFMSSLALGPTGPAVSVCVDRARDLVYVHSQ